MGWKILYNWIFNLWYLKHLASRFPTGFVVLMVCLHLINNCQVILMKKSIDICETVTLAVCQYIDPKINLAAGQRKNCLTLPVWNQGLLKSTPGISHHQFVWMSSKPLIGKLYNLHLAYLTVCLKVTKKIVHSAEYNVDVYSRRLSGHCMPFLNITYICLSGT